MSRDFAVIENTQSDDLPHNLELEQAVLGVVMTENRAFDRLDFLDPQHFYDPLHGRIYEAARAMVDEGRQASPHTIKTYFEADAGMQQVGGAAYLGRLVAAAPGMTYVVEYARTVRDLALRRDLITRCYDIASFAATPELDKPAADLLIDAQQRLMEIDSEDEGGRIVDLQEASYTALELVQRIKDNPDTMMGPSTGLKALDDYLGGLVPGELTYLAGRPGMGKTALGVFIGRKVAAGGAGAGFISLEMGAEQVAIRELSAVAHEAGKRVEYEMARRGAIDEFDRQALHEAAETIQGSPLLISDNASSTVAQIAHKAGQMDRILQRRHDRRLDVLIIDYLGLIQPRDRYRGNKVHEVTEISGELMRLAKRMNIHVICLSQLSRAVEHRDNKRPQLSDLRDSGSLEQDAHNVLFAYREAYYLEQKVKALKYGTPEYWEACNDLDEVKNEIEVIVAKKRQGRTGTARLWCDMAFNSFRDVADDL